MPTTPTPTHPAPALRRRGWRARGFTLIEVLVSLLILSVLAATCWKGVDAITSARTISDAALQRTLRLSSVLTQIEADLGQMVSVGVVNTLAVDSINLRLVRRTTGGVQAVSWFIREGRLWRWASPVTTVVGDLQKYTLSGFQLNGGEPGTIRALEGVSQMQVFCYVGGRVANCQSSRQAALPEAVRFQLSMAEGSGWQGQVTREVEVDGQ